MQKERQPEYEYLYSVQGYQFCDLLLGQGKYSEVQMRAAKALEWAKQAGRRLLTLALDKLSLGRAYMLETVEEGISNFGKAREYLDGAVEGLREAGDQTWMPRGLLARAGLYRNTGEFEKGWRDLGEAKEIADRGEMRLFLADCALEAARLWLAQDDKEKAKEEWEEAKRLVEETGYHRRDKEVEELQEELR